SFLLLVFCFFLFFFFQAEDGIRDFHVTGVQTCALPISAQHIAKPGRESALELAPRYQAPDYRGSGKLEGMKAIVTGADSGIGRAVAVLFAREGADVAIFYLDEHKDAKETARQVGREGRE